MNEKMEKKIMSDQYYEKMRKALNSLYKKEIISNNEFNEVLKEYVSVGNIIESYKKLNAVQKEAIKNEMENA